MATFSGRIRGNAIPTTPSCSDLLSDQEAVGITVMPEVVAGYPQFRGLQDQVRVIHNRMTCNDPHRG